MQATGDCEARGFEAFAICAGLSAQINRNHNMITELIRFNNSANAVEIKSKYGNGARLMRPKEFKEQYSAQFPAATNKQKKQAYDAYFRRESSIGCANVGAEFTSGNFGVTSFKPTKFGFDLKVVDKRKLGLIAEAEETRINELPEAEQKKILESLLAKFNQGPTINI